MFNRFYEKDKQWCYRSRKTQRKSKKKFRSNLIDSERGKWEHKSEEQKSIINNLKTFHKTKKKVMKLFDDYTTILSKVKYEAKHGKGLKILTPKQMLQRLSIALAQKMLVIHLKVY